ncbi:hypothetical protein GTR02_03845 [Kineococcus sp. R8]|uniref:hypothetical protein n=1 Tax=Kineococcus siccus TaxID=2696567 RepID=UPI001411F8A7|nr:hypothetical protein [Kineococcus siccus]NAZ80947.1 hypothetical protein [Kineococcus siccus]
MTGPSADAAVPDGVLLLLAAAVRGDLLTDADGMAAALRDAGWRPAAAGGTWTCAADPSWAVESVDHPPTASVLLSGWDHPVARAATGLRALLDAGEGGFAPDGDGRRWSGGHATVLLRLARQEWVGSRLAPALVQLDLTSPAGPAPAADVAAPRPAAQARRTARDGTPVARWYLAADPDLPDDVVAVLARDADPAVVAALAAAEPLRRLVRGER